MPIEWLLISLPAVFVIGWFAARLDIRHIRKNAGQLPRAYEEGLSHLLRDEKDKALDTLLRARPPNPDSVELQFAIGALSRQRGELRRAMTAHREICEREDLSADLRRRGLWELAQDYLTMGFMDYAEKTAQPLLNHPDYRERALAMLLSLKQRDGDYAKALELTDKMPPDALLFRRAVKSQLLCQCALAEEDAAKKTRLLESALAENPDCARAMILLGEAALGAGKYSEAATRFLAVERCQPRYLWLAAEGLHNARRLDGKAETGRRDLLRWLSVHPSPPLFECVYKILAKTPAGIGGLARAGMLTKNGAAPALCWIDEQSAKASGEERDAFEALRETLRTAAGRHFTCSGCGYEVNDFVWQCPGCLAWESFRPRQSS
ncbi:MAG: hypothetical protein ACR2P4_04250 [Gammaproteobacteria bacterium]